MWVCFKSKPKARVPSPFAPPGCHRVTTSDGSSRSTWGPWSHQPVVRPWSPPGSPDPFQEPGNGSQLPHSLLVPLEEGITGQ